MKYLSYRCLVLKISDFVYECPTSSISYIQRNLTCVPCIYLRLRIRFYLLVDIENRLLFKPGMSESPLIALLKSTGSIQRKMLAKSDLGHIMTMRSEMVENQPTIVYLVVGENTAFLRAVLR